MKLQAREKDHGAEKVHYTKKITITRNNLLLLFFFFYLIHIKYDCVDLV